MLALSLVAAALFKNGWILQQPNEGSEAGQMSTSPAPWPWPWPTAAMHAALFTTSQEASQVA